MRLLNYISLLLGLIYFTSGVNAASKPLFSEASVDAQSASAHEVINVHMMGHTHDDPGWLKTVDEYYTGANATIYAASVELIFDTVLNELIQNPERTYSFCEMSYFSRWYHEQSVSMREKVRLLVKNKQLVFLNGGWVMHDEAGSHYVSMIDQTTLGHDFLKDAFDGYTPKVGWQIDPFGHSSTHAWLSDEFGFDALYFGRIDYQDMVKRKAEKNLEFIWKGSTSMPNAQVFTGIFSSGNYGPPSGFCFDSLCTWCRDDPIVTDDKLETYNLDSSVKGFIEALEDEMRTSRGTNIMMKMGTDFTWSNAKSWFNSVDRLIEGVNARQSKFKLFWSNPERYTLAKAEEVKDKDISLTTKTDDFMPYADCAHCYWSGYFTSRPTIKYLERTSSSFLQTLRQAFAAAVSKGSLDENTIMEMRRIEHDLVAGVGLVNHHDAITGTEKQHVAYDYVKILSKARTAGEQMLAKLATLGSAAADVQVDVCRSAKNESACSITQSLTAGESANVLVYNSLPRVHSQIIDVFINGAETTPPVVTIQLGDKFIHADVLPTAPASLKVNPGAAPWTVRFSATEIPALSSIQYKLTVQDWVDLGKKHQVPVIVKNDGADLVIQNAQTSVVFDSVTGLMKQVVRHQKGTDGQIDDLVAEINNDIGYYISFGSPGAPGFKSSMPDNRDPHLKNIQPSLTDSNRDASTQPSGAYLFRPQDENEVPKCINSASSTRHLVNNKRSSLPDSCDRSQFPVQLSVIRGNTYSEVRQVFSDWATQIVRLYDNDAAVEMEWTVGPVPIDDNLGKEVVSKFFASNMNSGPKGANSVYTDSNGREFLHRVKDYRPTWNLEVHEPVAGNFYPITTAMYIKGDLALKSGVSKRAQLSVVVDRAQAGASLQSGEMEFMVHRRLLADDNRGVNEALNETTGGISPYPEWKRSGQGITVTGKHKLLLSSEDSGMKELRELIDEVYLPMTVVHETSTANEIPSLSLGLGLGYDLPVNVHLLTFMPKEDNTILLRLAHQFGVDEDAVLSAPVQVDLLRLLKPYHVKAGSLQEWTLSHNQLKKTQMDNKIIWSESTDSRAAESASHKDSMTVTLSPMQIKTFTVKCEAK